MQCVRLSRSLSFCVCVYAANSKGVVALLQCVFSFFPFRRSVRLAPARAKNTGTSAHENEVYSRFVGLFPNK